MWSRGHTSTRHNTHGQIGCHLQEGEGDKKKKDIATVTKTGEKRKGGDGDADSQADHGETFLEPKP